nr:putative receptor-like protein kinase At3g47110 [Malus domestica]
MGRLASLKYLNLSSNSLGGKIPTNISRCTQLRMFDVGANKLIGSIPDQLSSLLNLTHFWVDDNNLIGAIPDWIGNFSSRYAISLAYNNFKEAYQMLSGVTQNQLHGELPQNVGTTLPNLEIFAGGINKFTGSIPVSLSNASKLLFLDFAENGLTGKLPAENFGSLRSLLRLNFDDNRLGSGKTGDLNSLSFLANCTNLEVLSFSRNRFGGELPESIANLSTKLRIFTMGGNLIHGSIPFGIVNLVNLTSLGMEQNSLGGTVPDAIGKLQKLQGMYLYLNQFSGTIPSTLGNLTSVTRLFMEGNRFEGSIPPSLGSCQNLLMLNLSSNQLSGTIPKEVIELSSLSISLSISNSSLTRSLPSEVGELVHLSELDVSGNKLSGEIPKTLGSCASLVRPYLEGNEFERTIPQSLAKLRGLEELDISCNNLSGQIPDFLEEYFLVMAVVAVKVLNLQQEGASRSFIDECKTLRSIRHCNLLKIITACCIFQLKTKLQNITKGTYSVSTYLQRIKDVRDHLSAAGVTFGDDDIVKLALKAEEATTKQHSVSESFVTAMVAQETSGKGKALMLGEEPSSGSSQSQAYSGGSTNGGYNNHSSNYNGDYISNGFQGRGETSLIKADHHLPISLQCTLHFLFLHHKKQFWVVDTRATSHITSDLSNLNLATPFSFSRNDTVTTTSGSDTTQSPIPVDLNFQLENLSVVLLIPSVSLHPMQTRSKSSISKKKVFSATVKSSTQV